MSGEVWGDHGTRGEEKVADLDSNGEWHSGCDDLWEEYDYFYLYNMDPGIDEWTLEATCCEDCCAAQDVSCSSPGVGYSSYWLLERL